MIPFNKPYTTGQEFEYIKAAIEAGHLSGDGQFTQKCNGWLENQIGCRKALLTHSCTGALEMAAILANIGPGDEVIMPSFTFVSTANAFVLRGATPVFVDIHPDTLNIDESKIEQAVTGKTKAIVVVHYAGVGCNMDYIMQVAGKHGIIVIEDAAHGILASYKGHPLGSMGQLATLSFHETKNIIAGEGGALLVNDCELVERAEIIREKGTNRSRFFRGQVDKYTWVDIGSSYLPSEINAAFLWAQMEKAKDITAKRLELWDAYHLAFADFAKAGLVRQPYIPAECIHNAHMYYLLTNSFRQRTDLLEYLKEQGILAVFHYVPLHTSPAGQLHCRTSAPLPVTEDISERLIRLPLWVGMPDDQRSYIIEQVGRAIELVCRCVS